MNKLRSRVVFILLAAVVSSTLLACDIASLISQNNPLSQNKSTSEQGQPAPTGSTDLGTGKTAPPPAAKDASSRISDSLNRLLLTDKKVLDSYHLQVSGTEPAWNKTTQKIESEAFTLKGDVSNDNIHYIKTTKLDKETTTEIYLIGASAKDGGKGYSVQNGVVKEDLFAPLGWAMLPLDYGLPLIYGAMGPTPKGDEAVDGRAADKFDLDTAKAPAGTQGMLKGFGFNVYSAKGTAWLDKQTSALLKMNMDYERDVNDTSSGKVAGKGSGHIELVVTQVGKVTVTLPESKVSSGAATPAATKAGSTTKSGAATATATKAAQKAAPTPTATLPAATARVGQKVTQEGLAFTVTKVEKVTKGASAGYTWVVVHINVENASGDDATVELEQFGFIDKSGNIYDDLTNGPSAPDAYSDDVLGYEELAAGDKLQNKILMRLLKTTSVAGIKLYWTYDDEFKIVWNLGI